MELNFEEERQRALEQELHRRLLAGERSAPSALTGHFLPRLRSSLRREFPLLRDDPELEECALESLADYFQAPQRYRPREGTLWVFLHLAAHRDALNLLKKRGRTGQRELPLEPEKVAEEGSARKDWVEACLGIVPGLPDEVTLEELQARARAGVKAADRPVLELLMSGDEPLESYVAALSLAGRPRAEQERAVKRAKDRVWAALRRVRKSYEDG
jgi:hypothetical protein